MTRMDWNPHQRLFLDDRMVLPLDYLGHQQAYGVGSDVDGGVCKFAGDLAKAAASFNGTVTQSESTDIVLS